MLFGIRTVEYGDVAYGRYQVRVRFLSDACDHLPPLQPVSGINPQLDQLMMAEGLVYFAFNVGGQAVLTDDDYRF